VDRSEPARRTGIRGIAERRGCDPSRTPSRSGIPHLYDRQMADFGSDFDRLRFRTLRARKSAYRGTALRGRLEFPYWAPWKDPFRRQSLSRAWRDSNESHGANIRQRETATRPPSQWTFESLKPAADLRMLLAVTFGRRNSLHCAYGPAHHVGLCRSEIVAGAMTSQAQNPEFADFGRVIYELHVRDRGQL